MTKNKVVQPSIKAIKKEREMSITFIMEGSTIRFALRPLFQKKDQICLMLIEFSKFITCVILSVCHTSQFENLSFNISIVHEQGAFRHPPQSV
jgi:hypothetical protein